MPPNWLWWKCSFENKRNIELTRRFYIVFLYHRTISEMSCSVYKVWTSDLDKFEEVSNRNVDLAYWHSRPVVCYCLLVIALQRWRNKLLSRWCDACRRLVTRWLFLLLFYIESIARVEDLDIFRLKVNIKYATSFVI